MSTSPIDEITSASWWPEFLSAKDTSSWAALAERFGSNVNNLRAALASAGLSKAPMAPGRKPKNAPAAATQAVSDRAVSEGVASKDTSPGESSLDSVRTRVGTAPDADIAALAGVDVEAVKAYRRAHGISPFRRPPPTRVAAASTAAPAAPRTKPSESDTVVRRRRAKDGGGVDEVVTRTAAPAPVTERAPAPLAAEAANPLEGFRDQLGKVADHVIGEQANVDRTVVGAWRRKLGIPAYTDFRKRKPAEGAAPKAPARAAAKAPPKAAKAAAEAPKSVTKGKPGRRSAIDAYADLVGKMTDAEVAGKANVSVAAVTQYRIRRGIPAAGRAAARSAEAARAQAPAAAVVAGAAGAAKGVRHRRSKLDVYAHLVGKLSDAEVALLADVSSEGVRQYRRRHGIPAAGTRGAAAEAAAPVSTAPVSTAPVSVAPEAAPVAVAPVVAPVAAPAPSAPRAVAPAKGAAPAGVLAAYKVIARLGGENRRFVVLGTDIRDAVGRAVSALDARADGPWVVQSIRRLCDALA